MAVATTDLTQPINRKEALHILGRLDDVGMTLRNLVKRAQGNGHNDAPDYLDDALSLVSNAIASINEELDSVSAKAA